MNPLCPNLPLSLVPMGGGSTNLVAAGLCLALLFGAEDACAEDHREHALVLKMGPAGEWPSHERVTFGGTLVVKRSVIEDWLAI